MSIVSAVVMILIYMRLGDGQSLKNMVPTTVPLVKHPAPNVVLPSASMPKVDIQPVLSVIAVGPAASAASASGALTAKTVEPELVQVEKPAEQAAPAPTSKKQKSKPDMVSVNKKNKDKAKAKAKADALQSEDDRAQKCGLDPAQCAGGAVTHTPAIESTHPAASSEEAK